MFKWGVSMKMTPRQYAVAAMVKESILLKQPIPSIQELAKRMGVSRATLFKWFPDGNLSAILRPPPPGSPLLDQVQATQATGRRNGKQLTPIPPYHGEVDEDQAEADICRDEQSDEAEERDEV